MAKMVELLPVTYDSERFTMWADENFRRVIDAIGSLKAADIGSGSFPSGDFTVTGKITVSDRFVATDSSGSADLGRGWLELRSTGANPYVDFTRTPGSADYNMRLMNAVDGELNVYGGKFVVDSTVGTNVVAQGSGSGYEFRERDDPTNTAKAWVWYATGATARLWRSGYGDRITIYTDRPSISAGDINYIGYSGNYGSTFAQFGHWNYRNSTAYGYMQSSGGEVYISGPSAVAIHFRTDNTEKFYVDVNATGVLNRFVLNSNRVDTRGYGDDWHCWQWWSGNDGLRITEYGGLYYRVRDQDPALEILATGVSRFRKFDQIGAYDTAAIMTKSEGGGTGAKVGFWSAGQNAAQILKCWGSTIEGRTWDDGGWGIINADLNDFSTVEGKTKIKRLAKSDKTSHKAKMKNLEPIHYVRKTDEDDRCVNCHATGKAKKAHGDEFLDEPCPWCEGTKKKKLDKSQKKNAATGFLSFAAEEMAEAFPEAVHFDLDEKPVAIKPISVVAILWEQVKELEERLLAVEKKGQ